ncbi:hypothetical protein IJI69_04755 [Candidatus Saccharibacteria bacterium]|nr:hypothetical protein [Candidatus Saccharibacteria bacterium]
MNRISKLGLMFASIILVCAFCIAGQALAEGEEGGDSGGGISGESSGGDSSSAGGGDVGGDTGGDDGGGDSGGGDTGGSDSPYYGGEGSENTGGGDYGPSADSSISENTQASSGNSGDVSKYVFSSRSTGVDYFEVTSPGMEIHVPSLCVTANCSSDHFSYIPENNINTGDAAVGSKYYYLAIYAQNSGPVYIDGVKKYVQRGELLTYIPFGGVNGSKVWSIESSRGQFGRSSYAEVLELYYQMVAAGLPELSLNDLLAFGGLKDYLKTLDPGKVKELLCEVNCEKDPVPEPTTCHIGEHVGWTEGKANVTNLTTGTGWTGLVWARPGDTVRFKIDYCWGAQAVTGSNGNSGSPYAINNEGITQSNGDSFYPSRGGGVNIGRQWFQISANKGNGYLFGENEQYIGSSRHILTQPHNSTIGPATENQVPNEYVDSTSDYSFVVLSPSSKGVDSDRYNCSIFDFGAFTINGGHGYQIPGVGTGSCAAISGNGGNMNDAGSTISQTITYDNITAWQQWGHIESGKGCDGCCNYNMGSPNYSCLAKSDNYKNDRTITNQNRYLDAWSSADAAKGASTYGLYNRYANDTNPHEHQCQSPNCSVKNWSITRHGSHDECNCNEVWEDEHDDPNDPGKVTGRHLACHCGYHCVHDSWTATTYDKSVDGKSESSSACGVGYHETWRRNYVSNYVEPTDFNYTTSAINLGTQSSTATVNVPYSYRTATTSTIQEGDVIYLGETVNSLFTASIIPRVVSEVRPGEAYATVVPGYIKAVEFVVDANSSLSPATGSSNAGGSDPCSYYGSLGMISGCNTIWEEHGAGGYLNEEGRYGGKTYSSGSVTRVVPDIYPVGSKYCVAVGISTSDSHSQPDTQVVSGMSNISGWRISNLSCRTIAKKPNFQIWNGNFYTKGGIQTSITVKRVGANLGDPSDPTGYFGSWEEYVISAKGKVQGMSSGAGLGYYGGYNDKSLGLQGGNSPNSTFCKLSRMTISNSNCGQGTYGEYFTGNSLIEDSAATVLERIRSRYLSSTHGITQLENGATYIYPEQGSIKTSELASIAHGALSNTQLSSTVIRQTKSAINSESEQTTRNYASNALIIHVDGTLTIDTDICTGTGTCGSSNDLVLGNRNSDYYDNIYSLPQVLIIADGGIVISDRVTQIDAWLITNGNINTCNGLNASSGSFSASTCGNQLIVNGPVFANSLTPVRNSGANGGVGSGNSGGNPIYYNLTDDGSIQPAEIFNLRPDVLYWAYSQAQRFSQANVTYTRELAPRY